jgi:IS5 family transposase
MRYRFTPQKKLGGIDIGDIVFDICSRHELVAILMALQHVYVSRKKELHQMLELIEADFKSSGTKDCGCIGMSYWEALVLTSVRLGCNMDFDLLADLATNHRKLRQTLGLSDWEDKSYSRSTVHDNISSIKARTIRAIKDIIVGVGHNLTSDPLKRVRGDTFVLKKNIHYPTDTSMLYDGVCKIIDLCSQIADHYAIVGWRKHDYWKREVRITKNKIIKVARSRASNRDSRLKSLYVVIMQQADHIINKALGTVVALNRKIQAEDLILPDYWKGYLSELQYFIGGTEYVSELARRRILEGEKIPNPDKVFSLFEPDTELINRGKSPHPIEFGHRVLVIQDNAGFIIHDQVLDIGFTDEKIITEVMRKLQQRYEGQIRAASFDKGFWTPNNLQELSEFIPLLVLPKKGGRSETDRLREGSEQFCSIRKWHSGIESAIHALGAGNGMTVCRDKGPLGYERYVAMAILGRNLHVLGNILLDKERKRRRKNRDLSAFL